MDRELVVDRDRAIRNTHPTVVTNNGGKDVWDADGNVVVLDESKIATELARLKAEWDNQEYARKRKAEYDKLNQFEMMAEDLINGTTLYVDAIKAIKAKHPKE